MTLIAGSRRALALTTGPALVTHGRGRVGVVICDAWGYDALCARRSLRILSDRLAEAGYPSLRFDWPGTGDALDVPGDADPLGLCDAALDEAIARLRRETRVEAVVLIGLGFGALLALRAAERAPEPLAGLVLMAPVVKGRTWLRELQARSALIGEITGAPPRPGPDDALEIAGLAMSTRLAETMRAQDLATLARPQAGPVLVMPRAGKTGEERLAGRLATEAGDATIPFEGYDEMMGDPTGSQPPEQAFDRLIDWLSAAVPCGQGDRPEARPVEAGELHLRGDAFRETPILFGPQDRLFGVWCAPARAVPYARPVLFLNAGATPHVGWARGTVEMARALAERGIASLRMDAADIGDARPVPERAEIVHYDAAQIADLASALDVIGLRAGASGGTVVVGACSGAYLALNGAVADRRIAHVVAVNLQRFLWDPRDDVAAVLKFGHTSAQGYGRKLFEADKWRRVIAGKSDPLGIARNLALRAWRKGERALAPWLFGLSPFSRLYNEVHTNLWVLAKRDVRLDLLFSEGDPGLAQLPAFFGSGSRRMAEYRNLAVTRIPDADHNLTPRAARARLLEYVAVAARASVQAAHAAE